MYLSSIQEDMSKPIQLMRSETLADQVQETNETYNRFTLSERESQGRRTKLRVAIDVYARNRKGGLGFQRLRNKAVLLSCPTAEQASLAIDLICQVAASLEGKHLTQR